MTPVAGRAPGPDCVLAAESSPQGRDSTARTPGGGPGRGGRWLGYLILIPILAIALVVGARSGDGGRPATPTRRTLHIAAAVRCPTCEGLSAAESESPASVAIRQEIRRRVDAGQSDRQVRAFLVGRYGRDILLTPEGTGVAGLVWALPVAAVVLAGGGLALSFRRRRAQPLRTATADDRRLVEQALRP